MERIMGKRSVPGEGSLPAHGPASVHLRVKWGGWKASANRIQLILLTFSTLLPA